MSSTDTPPSAESTAHATGAGSDTAAPAPPAPELSKSQQKKLEKAERARLAKLEQEARAATGAADAPAAGAAEPPAELAVGLELMCDAFEDLGPQIGRVTQVLLVEGDASASVMLELVDLNRLWPIDASRIDLVERTWQHVPADYAAPGEDPDFDSLHRMPQKPAEAEQPPPAEAERRLAEELTAKLLDEKGEPAVVPVAATPPQQAKPEPIARPAVAPRAVIAAAPPAPVVVHNPPTLAPILPELEQPAAPAPEPAAPPGILCRVVTTGSVGGRWTRQSDGVVLHIAHSGDVGYFDPRNVAKHVAELSKLES